MNQSIQEIFNNLIEKSYNKKQVKRQRFNNKRMKKDRIKTLRLIKLNKESENKIKNIF